MKDNIPDSERPGMMPNAPLRKPRELEKESPAANRDISAQTPGTEDAALDEDEPDAEVTSQ